MLIEQIDHYCDLFEQRLKGGESLSPEQFLEEISLPPEEQMLSELRKLEREYRNGHAAPAVIHLESPPAEGDVLTEPLLGAANGPLPGAGQEKVIGRYKLLQKLGEGGMGVVYLAEQSQPVSRRVALKIVKPGMDSQEVLARFEAERQALALMDHPNIARVLDAGTTDAGLPYFVMELVKGTPITTYCDEKRLSPKERLELFLPICQAVQHAHQKGIIHRDLKPSNILVTQYDNKPVPKVIDFGLAKAVGLRLTEQSMFTQFGQIVGTLDYMSPEQASFNQLDVDTRSDIYSLGVVLYELLAGETPFDKKRFRSATFDEVLRIIRQEDPPRPSARLSSHASLPAIAANRKLEPKKLSVLLRGELDWIVMKAIDKERDRRYQSTSGFADDIHRYLDHETVLACPPSAGYRFKKFARRNRGVLAATGAVLTALLLGLVGTSLSLGRALTAEEQAKADLRRADSEIAKLRIKTEVTQFLTEQSRRFEGSTCSLLDRLTAKIGRDPHFSTPELQPLQRDLQADVIRFWDRTISTQVDRSGGPGKQVPYYRLQRALCLARLGDHKQAFDEMKAVRKGATRPADWANESFQVCAVCATAAKNEPVQAELYVEDAIKFLEEAADLAKVAPPSVDDPDLAVLASSREFPAILKEWLLNWKKRESGQAKK